MTIVSIVLSVNLLRIGITSCLIHILFQQIIYNHLIRYKNSNDDDAQMRVTVLFMPII